MNKFHQISTDKFKPLSYDNTYLFNHYDKVLNFIKARIGHKYGHILAKPVQRGYEIEWFSPFNGLHDVSEKNNKAALLQYFEFQDLMIEDALNSYNNAIIISQENNQEIFYEWYSEDEDNPEDYELNEDYNTEMKFDSIFLNENSNEVSLS